MKQVRAGRVVPWACLVLGGVLAAAAVAFEADQFSLPPQPLADIGPEIDEYLRQVIDKAIERVNKQIASERQALAAAASDVIRAEHEKAIQELLDESIIPERLRNVVGVNMPKTTIEAWLDRHTFRAQPDRHAISYSDTFFGASMIFKPLLAGAISPTINVYGTLQGMDKIGHFLQQGHDYYGIYLAQIDAGKSESEALAKAVDFGVTMESSWGGNWWTGAFSNGDLAANYAGMKFYLNLTRPVKVGDAEYPPILIRQGDEWKWNPNGDSHLIAPFVSEHWDESFNPSWYDAPMRGFIRGGIRSRAAAWVENRQTDRAKEEERRKRIETWFGEPYGFSGWGPLITILKVHFKDVAQDAPADQ